MKEDVERAQMTFPSLTTDNMNSVFSAIHHCWPSSTRREYSSVPLKTSNWRSGFCWKSKARLRQSFPFVFSSKSKQDGKKIGPNGTFCNLRGAIGSEKRHWTALIFLFWPLVLLAALLQNSYALSLHNQMLLLALRTAFFPKRRFPVVSCLSWQHNLTVSFKGWAGFSVFSWELPLSHC